MGIDVSAGGEVTVNPSHDQRVFTGFHRNPVYDPGKGTPVISLFRRTKHGDKERDGNPLIHALKRRDDYTISYSTLKALHGPFTTHLGIAVNRFKPTVVIPIPSSASINRVMTRRIIQLMQGVAVECDCLEKLTLDMVLQRAPDPATVDHNLRYDYTTALNRLQKSHEGASMPFEMKLVRPAKVRKFFAPLAFKTGAWGQYINGQNVVLVEDLVATGTTLSCATNILLRRYTPTKISVITLLSGL